MSSEQNALGKRPKNNVEAVLQSYKKCKIERQTRTWDWASKELIATANLQEGSKIYVKFDVETTYIPGEDEDIDDEGDDEDIERNGNAIGSDQTGDIIDSAESEGHIGDTESTSVAANSESKSKVSESAKSSTTAENRRSGGRTRMERILNKRPEDGAVKIREEFPSITSSFPGGSVTATITIEEESDDEDTFDDEITSRVERDENGKMVRVVNEQVVWWPAVVRRAPTETCASLRETWAALENDQEASSQLTPTLRKELSTMIEERGDAPIWNVRYEPREEFDKEEDLQWCAFFVDSHTLVHLEKGKVCIAPYKKALEDGSCPEESHGSSQASDVCALDALSAAIGVMETSVLSEMSNSDPADSGQVARNSIEFAGKFGGVLKGFFAEMAQTSDRVVTPGDVWKFFDRFLTTSSTVEGDYGLGSSSSGGDSLVNRTSTQSSEQPNSGKNDELEEAPFPRMPESPQ